MADGGHHAARSSLALGTLPARHRTRLTSSSDCPGPARRTRRMPPPVEYPGRFSGYTNYWQTTAWSWRQHGSLFLVGQPDVGRAVAQNKADMAEELGLPGLVLDEGFLDAWLGSKAPELEDPDAGTLCAALDRGDVLAWIEPGTAASARIFSAGPSSPKGRAMSRPATRPGPGTSGKSPRSSFRTGRGSSSRLSPTFPRTGAASRNCSPVSGTSSTATTSTAAGSAQARYCTALPVTPAIRSRSLDRASAKGMTGSASAAIWTS
ncbi:MAG: hypothetical protein MZV64_43840 [Ignavibacteriales bacterium]|nr:hypothetical protein [Ignavibacteriales bacterium]